MNCNFWLKELAPMGMGIEPQKRALLVGSHQAAVAASMSALGQKRTRRDEFAMSALPPKADIVRHGVNVRFVPQADSRTAAK
jgi:hypothetical protein